MTTKYCTTPATSILWQAGKPREAGYYYVRQSVRKPFSAPRGHTNVEIAFFENDAWFRTGMPAIDVNESWLDVEFSPVPRPDDTVLVVDIGS
jgi:hypothetical protein